MPRWQRVLCRVVRFADYVPRYGRIYRWNQKTQQLDPPIWKFRWRGLWGLYLLNRFGLLWPHLNFLAKKSGGGWHVVHLPDLPDDQSQSE
jgi:hypothetical protein